MLERANPEQRQIVVERPHLSLEVWQDTGGFGPRANQQRGRREQLIGLLWLREVEEGLVVFPYLVVHGVLHDADDFGPRSRGSIHADQFADRVRTRPEQLGHARIHDGDGRRSDDVFRAEVAAALERKAKNREVSR